MLEKKYNAMESEKKWQSYWEENKIYEFDPFADGDIYSIDTPPPTVNGKLHIGHIFSYTQAEMIARFQRMQGRNVFYPFGFDDNGLPSERLVEKEAGVQAKDLPRSKFTEMCIETTEKYERQFKELWQSLGFSVDWKLQYETINPASQRISQRSFIEMAKAGKAYMKETPVLWCTNCQTSIAQAELEWMESKTGFNHIIFKCENQKLSIATTRPELLYGCTALFVNPEDNRYAGLIGKKAVVPLYDYEVEILGDQRVAIEKGSGIVMCCTFGDSTDLEWYEDYKLPYRRVIEGDGRIFSEVPFIGGLKTKEARARIIELLKENNLFLKSDAIDHSVSIHERCGCETEIIPSRQWYIEVMSSKEELLRAGDEINWYPESMKVRYRNWVSNLKYDWCISRQRYFGVPFPVWYCEDCGKAILAHMDDLPVNPMEDKPQRPCGCGSNRFKPEEAVLDTWATSSVTPLINAKWMEEDDRSELVLPMSLRTQAHEIIRTWAFYTIVKSLFHTKQLPWRDIMICGFVMAKKGEKISKSKNNSENSPEQLIKIHSADAVRYWAASARLGTDIMFSEEELLGSKRFMNKLWNAARFALMHLEDFDNSGEIKLKAIDAWILQRLSEASKNAAECMSEYEVGAARLGLDAFFWNDFCDNYLEICKDRLYKPEIHGIEERKSAQYAVYHSLLGLLKLYAPFIPHMTEEIYQSYFAQYEQAQSIHLLKWNKRHTPSKQLEEFGNIIERILTEVRRYKSEKNLSLRAELRKVEITVPASMLGYMKDITMDLKACTAAEEIVTVQGEGVNIFIEA